MIKIPQKQLDYVAHTLLVNKGEESRMTGSEPLSSLSHIKRGSGVFIIGWGQDGQRPHDTVIFQIDCKTCPRDLQWVWGRSAPNKTHGIKTYEDLRKFLEGGIRKFKKHVWENHIVRDDTGMREVNCILAEHKIEKGYCKDCGGWFK